jgi:hypothetical protein
MSTATVAAVSAKGRGMTKDEKFAEDLVIAERLHRPPSFVQQRSADGEARMQALTRELVVIYSDERERWVRSAEAVRADTVRATDRVAVVIPDLTRPLPSDRLLPWQ